MPINLTVIILAINTENKQNFNQYMEDAVLVDVEKWWCCLEETFDGLPTSDNSLISEAARLPRQVA